MNVTIARLALPHLIDAADTFRVVIVNGPRQSGKTTLLRLFEAQRGGLLRSLDDPTTLRTALEDPTEFARYGSKPRVIDEVQRGGDDLVLAVKYEVDRDNARGQYVLSGSTRFLTVPNLSESLAGRAVFVEVWPFAMAERFGAPGGMVDLLFSGREAFLGASSSPWTRRGYLEAMCTGGYPEVVDLVGSAARHRWFDGYLSMVVLRDVTGFAQIHRGDLIPQLLGLVAARAGSAMSIADLALGLQLNQATVRNYLGYLETVFLIGRLRPWSTNLTSKLVKTPKMYPTDSGLAEHLLQTSPEALAAPGNPTAGILAESFVFAELTRLLAVAERPAQLYFYRDRDGREVDFVIEGRDGRVVGIEVKASSTVKSTDFRHLRWLKEKLGDRFAGGYVLYLGPETHPFGDGMAALPMSVLWQHMQ